MLTFILFYLTWFSQLLSSPFHTDPSTINMSESDSYKGWHAKALQNPHGTPHLFMPDADYLSFVLMENSQVEENGFTLAVFKPSLPDPKRRDDTTFVVDAMGRVLYIPIDLYVHMSKLAEQTTQLPDTGSFRNTWRVEHPTTSRAIDRLFVKTDSGLKETSVYGYSDTATKLQTPVDGYTDLPDVLQVLFGLALEGRSDYKSGEADKEVIDKVKKVIGV
jgi:hypothetical protein